MSIETGIAWGMTQLGKPYDSSAANRFGPDAYDCSGLVSQILRHAGMAADAFPTNSADMTRYLVAHPELRLTRAQARNARGAIILLGGVNGYGPAGHVGMSLGDGTTIEARGGRGVGIYQFDSIQWDDCMVAPGIPATPPPAPLPSHPSEDSMLLVRGDKQPAVYRVRADRTAKVWVPNEATLTIDQTVNGQLGFEKTVIVWAQGYVDTIPIVGPRPNAYTGV